MARFPELGEKAEEEMLQFVSNMSTLQGPRKESVFKMSAKQYWSIIGQNEYPNLNLCAKPVNDMICSSAAAERVWSIYRFIHSRLRNRLDNEKVDKIIFIYVNSVILEKSDQGDFVFDEGALFSGIDCQQYEDD